MVISRSKPILVTILISLAASESSADGINNKNMSQDIVLKIKAPQNLLPKSLGVLEILAIGQREKGGFVLTTGCDIGYSIKEKRTGREVFKYPGGQPCPEQIYKIVNIKGHTTTFKLPIDGKSLKGLKGIYTINATITPVIESKGLKRLPKIMSSPSYLTIR